MTSQTPTVTISREPLSGPGTIDAHALGYAVNINGRRHLWFHDEAAANASADGLRADIEAQRRMDAEFAQ